MKNKTHLWLLSLCLVLLWMLTGCGTLDTSKEVSSANAQVKKVVVGTGTHFPNVCFLDTNGNLTGFDVELVKEIDRLLPGYEFTFKTMDFSNLLVSLETNKINFIAHQMEKNPDREKRFLFNNEPYNIFPNKVVVREDNNNVHSIDDLKGKKVVVSPTSNEAYILEQYNKTHNNEIQIVYTKGSDDQTNQLKTGRADATISTQFAVDYLNKSVDAKEKTVGPALTNSKVFFILRKNETELSTQIDKALKEIKADGTLSKLSVKWLGRDYSKEINS